MYKIGLVLTIALLLFAGVGAFPFAHAAPPSAVNLGTAGGFAILSESGITDVPTSAITGNIGTSPITGASITGLTCAEVTGIIYTVDATGPPCRVVDPARLTTAVGDMMTAYTDAAGRACGTSEGVTNLSGQTITTGVYCWTGTLAVTGSFTISGSSSDVFIFQIPGTLTVSNGVVLTLIGGAIPSNIFWQVGGATTIGTTVSFQGVILDATNIAMQGGASLTGRALAQTAVTLIMNTVNAPSAVNAPATTTTSVRCSPSTVTVGSHTTCTATVTSTGSAPLTGTLAFTSSDPTGTFTNMKCSTNNNPGGDRTGNEGGDDDNGNGSSNGNVLRCTVDYSSASTGTQTMTAAYSGDPNNASSVGTFTLTVTLTPTHTSLTCDPSNVQAGESTKCEAEVTSKDRSTSTGSVTFTSSDSQGTFGQVTCAAKDSHQDAKAEDKGEGRGALTCVVDYTSSSAGTQTITATYSGDASHSPSSATFNLNGGEDGGDDSSVLGSSLLSLFSPLS